MIENNRRVISDKKQIEAFTFAGRAEFTLRSRKTEARFTYKVKASKDKNVFFVSLKQGAGFNYIGYVKSSNRRELIHSKKSRLDRHTKEFSSFQWFLTHIGHEALEFWHEGRCGHCAKKLTVPESIVSGFGPVCLGKKITRETVKKAQVMQGIESINDLIRGRAKIGDPDFKRATDIAKSDIEQARLREKYKREK